jgi:hypothetical protein
MNVDEALRQFANPEEFPRAALQWALDHWEEAGSRFVARLRAFAASPAARDEIAEDEIFFIVHLCGEKRDPRAYAPLCRLIGESEEATAFLGDAEAETLGGILINLCDDDPLPLMGAIESENGAEFSRAAALESLGWLTRARGLVGDDEMRAYLGRLRRAMKPRGESYLWQVWAQTAANLGYDDLRADAARLHAEGWVDPREFGLGHFDQQVKLARSTAGGLAGFEADGVIPLEPIIETLASWSYGESGASADDEFGPSDGGSDFAAPYVNPLRGVGRNDPCPCGSGKKYKRCCLTD